jgi:hypothetical protein
MHRQAPPTNTLGLHRLVHGGADPPGSVWKVPSGRYQAHHAGPDGPLRTAPDTFDTKRAAEDWLVETQAEMLRGEWLDPNVGNVAAR